jgi:hypothetical protein
MSDITTVEVVAKREDATIEPIGRRTRKGTVLTDRPCETRVKTRKKYYDRRTRGLYVSITPGGIATFAVNYTDAAGRPTSRMLGVYSETFKVAHARAEVAALKAKGGAAIGELLRQRQAKAATQGITVAQLIEKRIEFMSTEEMKDDGKKRPRIESWEGVARHLRNFVSTKLGHMVAKEVTADDIATLSNDIRDGNHGGKPSPSNARHARRACSAMFKWAMQPGSAGKDSAGRGIRFLDDTPCRNLPKLKKGRPKTRVRPRTRSGRFGTVSTARICPTTAPRGSPSSSPWSPCCVRMRCCRSVTASWRTARARTALRSSTSRPSGSRSGA